MPGGPTFSSSEPACSRRARMPPPRRRTRRFQAVPCTNRYYTVRVVYCRRTCCGDLPRWISTGVQLHRNVSSLPAFVNVSRVSSQTVIRKSKYLISKLKYCGTAHTNKVCEPTRHTPRLDYSTHPREDEVSVCRHVHRNSLVKQRDPGSPRTSQGPPASSLRFPRVVQRERVSHDSVTENSEVDM